MVPGKLIRLAPGRPHRLEAKQDSRMLVTMIKQSDASAWNALTPRGRTLDLRQTPRERRHSTVFYAFDNLALGESFQLVTFLFRTCAGLYFTWIYNLRGFGIAVGAHASYDVLVGLLMRGV